MKKYTLTAQKRTLAGRKVKNLRTQGLLPANIFGKDVKSLAVQMPLLAFAKVYGEAGETGLVEIQVDSETRPVLIQNVQIHPVTGVVMHADLYQVDLKEKVKANVPLEVMGEAPAVSEKLGVLLMLLDEVEVEALPAELPEKIEVGVENLKAVGDSLKVADLKIPTGVEVLTDSETEVCKIDELVSKEAEEQAAADEAAASAASAEAAPAEGAGVKTDEAAKEAPKADGAKPEAPAKEDKG